MVTKFPLLCDDTPDADDEIKVQLELTFDVPKKIAEQVELWGLYQFEACSYDEKRRRMVMTATSTFYRKGA